MPPAVLRASALRPRVLLLLAMLVVLATSLVPPAAAELPSAPALDHCAGPACLHHQGAQEGTWHAYCGAEGQSSEREVHLLVGDAWLVYTERCREEAGDGWSYQWLAAGTGPALVYASWTQEAPDGERACSLVVNGVALPCLVAPLTLP